MLVLLLACTEPVSEGDPSPKPGVDPIEPIPGVVVEDPDVIPGDTDGEDPVDTSDTGSGADDGQPYSEADVMFGLDMVHTVDITLGEEAVRALRANGREYVEGDVVIDGTEVASVGVKLKGSGSYQPLSGKSAFKIDFNRYVEEQEFLGMSKMTLNNMTHDGSQVHELLAYAAFAAAGLPTHRVGYAWVTVNGEDYGLYSHIESISKGWMERNFDTREGRVYEGGYPGYPESWEHADFSPSEALAFNIELGDEVANEDVIAAAEEVATRGDDWDDRVGQHIDLEEYARFHVVEAWVGQWDGYAFASASNNYRIYVDSGSDVVSFVPSGMDYTFLEYASEWRRGNAPVARSCSMDSVCSARQVAAAIEVTEAIDAADLKALRAEAWALIESYVEADPRKVTNISTIVRAQDDTDTWIDGRSAKILGWYEE